MAVSVTGRWSAGEGLQGLYERRERNTEELMRWNLENIRVGTFHAHHGIGGLSSPTEWVYEKAKYWRERNERFRNNVSRLLETTSHLELAEDARQYAENIICSDEDHGIPLEKVLELIGKVAPGHPDAGAPLLDCSGYLPGGAK